MITGQSLAGTVGSTGVQEVLPCSDPRPLQLAQEIAETASRREHCPVRKSFARSDTADHKSPLSVLVDVGGRGGAVPVKLLLALLWRCSKEPFDTNISARKWAALLGLPDSNTGGARRITDAIATLARLGLVDATSHRGEPSTITLRQEDGSGHSYSLPSTAYTRASKGLRDQHRYFKVPTPLWTRGHLQPMSMPALAVLLILLAEEGGDGREIWWSTSVFPARYGISPATRSKGTRELIGRRLLYVQKRLVGDSPNQMKDFGREKVRNVYQLINDAVVPVSVPVTPDPWAEMFKRSEASPTAKRS